jgi:hypothetical protein
LTATDPGVSTGSVQPDAVSPFRVRAALMAVRSSLMCVAFVRVLPVTSGLSVKVTSALKLAVTDAAAFIVTVQVLVPVQAPLQPVKPKPVAGNAVRVTVVPPVKEAEQVAPHEMPAGELVTVPEPSLVTVSAKDGRAKVAVTSRAALIVTVQVLVPVQAPLKPVKIDPAVGEAVRVTTVPLANGAEQVAPQETPAGELVTVPLPLPALVTVSVKGDRAKVAVTEAAAFMVTMQVLVPEQPPPLQPVNVEPAAGAAVRVTTVPLVNDAAHVEPQEMPAGLLVTVPLPAPALDTVRVEPFETPVPVTSRDNVSPLAVKLTLVLAPAMLVGANRTVTVAVAPVPTRVKGLPDTIEKGAGTDAVPVVVPGRVLWTVKV